jgi:hypothetical protein
MAITKAISGNPVRGYYVTTINTGRVIQQSGKGFGVPRLGGLINAQVDGLTGGGTGATRLQTARVEMSDRQRQLQHYTRVEEERLREEQHEEFKEARKEAAEAEREAVEKGKEVQEKVAKQAAGKKAAPKTVEIVKDPATGEQRVTGKDNAVGTDLDDPKKLAAAEVKTVEQQKKESAPEAPKEKK